MLSNEVPVERGERYWIAGIANAAIMEKNSMEVKNFFLIFN